MQKVFVKIQHPFMIKSFQKVGIEGTFLNIIKAIYDKPTASIVLNDEKLKPFPLRSGRKEGRKEGGRKGGREGGEEGERGRG